MGVSVNIMWRLTEKIAFLVLAIFLDLCHCSSNANRNNFTQTVYPLRIPPDLKEFYVAQTKAQRPRRSLHQGSHRQGKQLEPGVYSCGHQGNDMFINFINPRYPGHDVSSGTCHFRLLKNNPNVCQVRLKL